MSDSHITEAETMVERITWYRVRDCLPVDDDNGKRSRALLVTLADGSVRLGCCKDESMAGTGRRWFGAFGSRIFAPVVGWAEIPKGMCRE